MSEIHVLLAGVKELNKYLPIILTLSLVVCIESAYIAKMEISIYFPQTIGTSVRAPYINSMVISGGNLVVYVQNVRGSPINLVSGQCLYINGMLNAGTATPTTLAAGANATITSVGVALASGDTVTVKVATAEGAWTQVTQTLP